jgi:hypothetical protein
MIFPVGKRDPVLKDPVAETADIAIDDSTFVDGL